MTAPSRPLCGLGACARDAVGVLLPEHAYRCAQHKPTTIPPGAVWRRLPSPRLTREDPR